MHILNKDQAFYTMGAYYSDLRLARRIRCDIVDRGRNIKNMLVQEMENYLDAELSRCRERTHLYVMSKQGSMV
ncbi:hypothetical protein POTOM_002651 [Populus tomentosa]|uniref:Uncharacterized protein n=1 Tax=Populus tomentosa TaxID=118781 RepID=A0A8X8IY11_POPTO|nr:hypothetical protein POTOM_002651 [Populus tomentosa]